MITVQINKQEYAVPEGAVVTHTVESDGRSSVRIELPTHAAGQPAPLALTYQGPQERARNQRRDHAYEQELQKVRAHVLTALYSANEPLTSRALNRMVLGGHYNRSQANMMRTMLGKLRQRGDIRAEKRNKTAEWLYSLREPRQQVLSMGSKVA